MRILILVFLFSGWICYSEVAGVGEEVVQDPNDPKYQEMAKELVHDHLRIKNVKSIQVLKVTTQTVSGLLTRIHLRVIPIEGRTTTCQFRVWEQQWINMKHITYKCDAMSKKTLMGTKSPPRPVQMRNPKNPKYQKLAASSIDSFLGTPGTKPFKKEDIKAIQVAVVKVLIGSIIESILEMIVSLANNKEYKCTSKVSETPWSPEQISNTTSVKCIVHSTGVKKLLLSATNHKDGREEYKNPDDPKYEKLAKEIFEKHDHNYPKIKIKEYKVTKATEQIVAGVITRIDFYVIPVDNNSFPCKAMIIKGTDNKVENNLKCTPFPKLPSLPGGERVQNPDDPKYVQLAKESFDKYQQSHIGILLKELKVTRVTRQAVEGWKYKIVFYIITTYHQSFPCHSDVYEKEWQGFKDIKVKCGENSKLALVSGNINQNRNTKVLSNMGAQEYENPDDPKYEKLAKEVFRKRFPHIKVKEYKVTKATEQIVAGIIIRIDFYVIPANYNSFPCQTEIYDKFGDKNIDLNCKFLPNRKPLPGSPVPVNPDDPKYFKFAKESFDKYQQTHISILLKELKVTRVTRQVVNGIKYQIVFYAISTEYESYSCHSEVYEKPGQGAKEIKVNCGENSKLSLVGGKIDQNRNTKVLSNMGAQEYENPDDPKYEKLAKEVFRKRFPQIKVKEYKVTKATEQTVAGIIIRIDFYVIPPDYNSFPCQTEIYDKFGDKNIDLNCELLPNRKPLPGSEVPVNPDDPKYFKLAKESFDKYQQTHIGILLKELKVTRVTRQAVEGWKYKIVFYIITTYHQSFPCHSDVYEKEWQGFKDIKVKCGENSKLALVSGNINQNRNTKVLSNMGAQEYENPDDPKYEKLAKQVFRKRFPHIKVKEYKVTKATEQTVAGIIIRIDFYVIPPDYNSFPCQTEIYDKFGDKNIDLNCKFLPNRKPLPGSPVPVNPDDPKYFKLAKESFDKYQQTHISILLKELKVTRVTRQVVNGIKYQIVFYAISTDYESHSCHSEVYEKPGHSAKEIKVNCGENSKLALVGGKIDQNRNTKVLSNMGAQEYENPDDPKYEKLAKEVFRKRFPHIKVKEYKVTKATEQTVAGIIIRIDFYVIPPDYNSFPCQTEIYDKFGDKNIDLNCEFLPNRKPLPGSPVPVNPDDPKYFKLAKESFDKYQQTHIGILLKELKVTRVTRQAVEGWKYKIVFYIITTYHQSFPCHSDVYEKEWQGFKDIKVKCGENSKLALVSGNINQNRNTKVLSNMGAQEYENPDDPKYEKLAKEVFRKRFPHIKVKEYKVTKATEQIVAGIIIRIDFYVIPADYNSFPCQTEIYDKFGDKNIDLNCKFLPNRKPLPGSPVPVNPDDPKYFKFAKESFDKYQQTHISILLKELKVTRVTRQVVNGIKYQIVFYAISTEYESYSCHSEVYEKPGQGAKEIKVSCGENSKLALGGDKIDQNRNTKVLSNMGAPEYENPDDPKYEKLAKEVFRKRFPHRKVKEYKVTKATEQTVAGIIIRIDFYVIPPDYDSFPCQTEIYDKFGDRNIDLNCEFPKKQKHLPGSPVPVNPDDPKYVKLAQEFIHKYKKTLKLKVTRVTRQVVSGIKYQIVFFAISKDYKSLSCHSEVYEKPGQGAKEIKGSCRENSKLALVGGKVDQNRNTKLLSNLGAEEFRNPDDPEYKQLAKESYKKYIRTHKENKVNVKEIIVTQVTTQVVNGEIYGLVFYVIPTHYRSFSCRSSIYETSGRKDINVSCDKVPKQPSPIGGQVYKNPALYTHLAEELFKRKHIPIKVKEFKVTKASEQSVQMETIIRTTFYVIPTKYNSFRCDSMITKKNLLMTNFMVECGMRGGMLKQT